MNSIFKTNKKQRFSLRKLSIGLVSLLLGFSFYITTNDLQIVKADVNDNSVNSNSVTTNDTTKLAESATSTTNNIDNADANSNNNLANNDNTNNTNNTNSNDISQNHAVNTTNTDSSNQQLDNKTNQSAKLTKAISEKWNGVDVSYDKDKQVLTINGGTITDPKPIAKNITNYEQIREINFADKLTVYGDAIGMLGNLSNLTHISNLNNLDTSNVTNMDYFFDHDAKLTDLDLSEFDTHNVNSMNNMFASCTSLATLNLSNFDTSQVQFMMHMFDGASGLTNLDLRSFNTTKVADMSYMFRNVESLTSLDLSSFDTRQVEFMMHMFENMTALTSLDLSTFDTSNVTDMSYMFSNMTNLASLNIYSFNTEKVQLMMHMFNGNKHLTDLDVSTFNTSNVTDMSYMFSNMSSLENLDLSSFNTNKVIYFMHMFDNDEQLESIDLTKFDTSYATDMSYMFNNNKSLNKLDLSMFDTSKVIYFMHMFDGDAKLTKLDLSNFKTPQAEDISYLFNNCTNLTKVNLTNFDLTNVKYINNMFNNCLNLVDVNTDNFGNNSIVSMSNMFNNCRSLTKLNLNRLTTTNALYMSNIFNNCSSLKELYIKQFDLHKVVDANNMLANLPVLAILELGETIDLTNTGLNTPKSWIRVNGGTITKPKGTTLLSSEELIKYYQGSRDADIYVHSTLPEYNIIIKYYDIDDQKLLFTDTKLCANNLISIYHDILDDNLKKLSKEGYLYSKDDSNLPLNSNNDIKINKLDSDKTYIVALKHHKVEFQRGENNPITNQNDDENLVRIITQTIKYNGTPNEIEDHIQQVEFVRTGVADLVTKKVEYGTWNKKSAAFKDVKSPQVDGYSANPQLIKGTIVTPEDKDIVQNVQYSRIPMNQLVIKFIDQDNDNLPINAVSIISNNKNEVGKPITKFKELTQTLDKLASLGYDISVDPLEKPLLALDGEQVLTYVMKHKLQKTNQTVNWTQTINFIDQNGQILKKPNIQSVNATKTGVIDLVTNKTTWNNNWVYDNGLTEVKVPVVNGYLTNQKLIKPSTINPDENITINVVYQKIGKFIPVDSQGNLLTNKELIYQNDSTDPTKLASKQVLPDIAGYQTPEVPKITDPVQDTKVIYQKLINDDTNNEHNSNNKPTIPAKPIEPPSEPHNEPQNGNTHNSKLPKPPVQQLHQSHLLHHKYDRQTPMISSHNTVDNKKVKSPYKVLPQTGNKASTSMLITGAVALLATMFIGTANVVLKRRKDK